MSAPASSAQPQSAIQTRSDDPLSRPARDWAADAAANERAAIQFEGVLLRYRIHMTGAKGDQIRDVLESKDGTVARLIYKENHPLTAEEDAAEHERLQAMLDSPAAFAKHVKGDSSGKKFASDLVTMMPRAMIYSYAVGQPQRNIESKGEMLPEVVLDFRPDPSWVPPTMMSEALTGLRGRLWIDIRTRHVTRFEGTIFQMISVGWGMLARVAPGGTLTLEQVPVAGQRWVFSHFVEHLTLRALMVKTVKENSEIEASQFQTVKPMSYKDAIRILLDTPLPHSQ